MKLKVNIGDLVAASAQAKTTIDKHSQMASTHLFLRARNDAEGNGSLYFYSTDLHVQTLIKTQAEVEEPGELLVSPGLLAAVLLGRPPADSVSLETKDKHLLVRYKNRGAGSKIPFLDDTKFQADRVARLPNGNRTQFHVRGADMSEFVRRGIFCVATNDKGQSGQMVGGMYFTENENGYEAQATDGAVATQIKVKADKGDSKMTPFLMPLRALTPVSQLLGRDREADVGIIMETDRKGNPTRCFFKWEDAMLGSELLIGQFPQLKQIVDNAKATHRFLVRREDLRGALGRCAGVAGQRRTIRIVLEKGILWTRMINDSTENLDDIEIEHAAPVPDDLRLEIAVNMDYLFNIASSSHAEKLLLGMSTSNSPMIVEDNSEERVSSKYVIMPLRIGKE